MPCKGFIDGDFIESFPLLSPELMEAIVRGDQGGVPLDVTVDGLLKLIEDCQLAR